MEIKIDLYTTCRTNLVTTDVENIVDARDFMTLGRLA